MRQMSHQTIKILAGRFFSEYQSAEVRLHSPMYWGDNHDPKAQDTLFTSPLATD